MSKNISPDSVRCGRTCPANLGVRSCPVRKLICPVRSSPMLNLMQMHFHLKLYNASQFSIGVKLQIGVKISDHRLIAVLHKKR